MQAEPGETDRTLPWEARLAAAVPLPPLWTAAAIAGGLVGLHLGVQALLGFPHRLVGEDAAALPQLSSGLRSGVVVSLLIAYTITAGRFAYHGAAKDLRSLGRPDAGPRIDLDAFETGRVHVTHETLVRSRFAGAAGAGLALALIVSYTTQLPGFEPGWLWTADFWASEWVWAWPYLPLLFWCVARALWFNGRSLREMAELGSRTLPVDLLDPEPRQRFGRIALRNSLIWIVGLTLASLLFLDTGVTPVEAGVILAVLAFGAASFFVPVLPVRSRLRAVKAAELRRVDEQLRVLRDRVAAGRADPPGALADRLAWRGHVAGISEWPFDPSTLVRLGVYLLIPIGSWIGGALVERLIDRALE